MPGGWDTHANQGGAQGPLAQRLRGLDDGLADAEVGARHGLAADDGAGRHGVRPQRPPSTARAGRTTARRGCAFLVGGAVAGGRVLGDWPGLAARDLHEGRDLRATTDLRALFKAVLHERFDLGEAALARTVFPASDAVEPLDGLTA